VGAYPREFRKLFDKHSYDCTLDNHFGQGCIHVRIDFDFETRAGIDNYLSFLNEASELVVIYAFSVRFV
jgi:FAD/FMN-containing dehydrogenase